MRPLSYLSRVLVRVLASVLRVRVSLIPLVHISECLQRLGFPVGKPLPVASGGHLPDLLLRSLHAGVFRWMEICPPRLVDSAALHLLGKREPRPHHPHPPWTSTASWTYRRSPPVDFTKMFLSPESSRWTCTIAGSHRYMRAKFGHKTLHHFILVDVWVKFCHNRRIHS